MELQQVGRVRSSGVCLSTGCNDGIYLLGIIWRTPEPLFFCQYLEPNLMLIKQVQYSNLFFYIYGDLKYNNLTGLK
jgi:hypothetical protein